MNWQPGEREHPLRSVEDWQQDALSRQEWADNLRQSKGPHAPWWITAMGVFLLLVILGAAIVWVSARFL